MMQKNSLEGSSHSLVIIEGKQEFEISNSDEKQKLEEEDLF